MRDEDASRQVEHLRQELTRLQLLDTSEARTMPPSYYTSEAFLDLEREEVFRKEWVCLGHVAEISKPGDYFTTDLIGEPLLVVRGDDGLIRVLSNVCRHRANLVAEGSGNRRRFVCNYHFWSYSTDGHLATAPLMGKVANFDKTQCRLPEFKSEIWQDFIFVNLDGTAEPLAPRVDWFLPHIANYHHPGRHHQFVAHDTWATNWKSLVENFMEGYHLSAAHLKTLHPMTPTSMCRKIPCRPGITAYTSGYDPSWPERGPYHVDLTPEERRYSVLFSVFPNLLVSIVPNVTLYMMVRPIDAGTVGIKWGLAGNIADPEHPDVARYRDLCFAFNAEDRAALEGVQKGMQSRHFRSGRLAPPDFEGTIWDFYQYMASRLGGGTDPDANRTAD
jgi:choline monooxygenase